MFFQNITSTDSISAWVARQIDATRAAVKYGWDVEIKPHKKQRSYQQNRYLMAVMENIVRFYHDTGYMPAGCAAWAMRTDVQKEYWKARLGVASTAKLSTTEFGEFVDRIQGTMAAESGGEYEIITPPDAYVESLTQL